MTPVLLLNLALAAYCAVEFSIFTFVSVYSFLAPWWNDAIGRTIIWHDIVIAMALIIPIFSLVFNVSIHEQITLAYVDVVILFIMSIIMFWRTFLWYRIHTGKYQERQRTRRFFKWVFRRK